MLKNEEEDSSILRKLKKMSDKRILIVGDTALYLSLNCKTGSTSHRSHVGEQIYDVERIDDYAGGVYRIARILKPFVKKVNVVTIKAHDNYGQRLSTCVTDDEGIDDDMVTYDNPKRMTTVKVGVFRKQASELFPTSERESAVFRLDYEDPRKISEQEWDKVMKKIKKYLPTSDLLIIRDANRGLLDGKRIREILSKVNHKTKVIINPRLEWECYVEEKLNRNISILRYNEDDIGMIIGTEKMMELKSELGGKTTLRPTDVEKITFEIGKLLLAKKFKTDWLVFTLGQHGAFLIERSKNDNPARFFYVPKNPLNKEVSHLGSGYEFISFMACALLSGLPAGESLEIANLGGAIGMEKQVNEIARLTDLESRFPTRSQFYKQEFVNEKDIAIRKILNMKKISLKNAREIDDIIYNPNSTYGKTVESILQLIQSWQPPRGDGRRTDLIVIYGDSASGKTSLVKAILDKCGYDTLKDNASQITRDKIRNHLNNSQKKAVLIDNIFDMKTDDLLSLIGDPSSPETTDFNKICFVLVFRTEPPVDLFNRTAGGKPFRISPLEEKLQDLPYIIANMVKKSNIRVTKISYGALECLLKHKYRGKELSGFMLLKKIMDDIIKNIGNGDKIKIEHIPKMVQRPNGIRDGKEILVEY